jgi:hypothetical protein
VATFSPLFDVSVTHTQIAFALHPPRVANLPVGQNASYSTDQDICPIWQPLAIKVTLFYLTLMQHT